MRKAHNRWNSVKHFRGQQYDHYHRKRQQKVLHCNVKYLLPCIPIINNHPAICIRETTLPECYRILFLIKTSGFAHFSSLRLCNISFSEIPCSVCFTFPSANCIIQALFRGGHCYPLFFGRGSKDRLSGSLQEIGIF